MEHDPDLHEGEPAPLPEEPTYFAIHPLFPLPEGVRETKEIYQVTFDRWDHKGIKERCPDRFLASELRDFGQVIDMFGGGTYQFIAFDSKGNFSRWTPHNERLHSSLPCKPLRASVQQHIQTQPPEDPQPGRATPAPGADLIALLMQQSIAAQERAAQERAAAQERSDRLMQALLERLATPPQAPTANDKFDGLIGALVQRLAAPPSPGPDPMAMLTGLATVFEKLRPTQISDPISQLSGLVSVAEKINGRASSTDPEETALQPLLTMMTQAMSQGASQPSQPPAQPQRPALPPGMIWVDTPQLGLVLMRPEQAARVFAPPPAARAPEAPAPAPPAPPAAPPPAPAATGCESWESIAARLTDPREQAAFKAAIEQQMQAMSMAQSVPRAPEAPAPSPITAAPAPAPQAPEAPHPPQGAASAQPAPRAPQAQPPAAPAPAAPTPAAPAPQASEAPKPTARPAPRCFVCQETGSRDPAQPHVLICRNNHRSLIPGEPIESDQMVPLSLDSLPISIDQLDALLADETAQKEIPPQVLAALRQIRSSKVTA